MGLCDRISRELGQEFAVGRVLVQQQLPRESGDGTIQSAIWMLMTHSTLLD
jgi:hypothetical protein